MAGNDQTSWPEHVGRPWQEAETGIKALFPNITVQVLPEDSMVTMDYRTDRVRVFIDGEGKVCKPPMIG